MKKTLTFGRKTAFAMLVGVWLVAVSTLGMAQGIPVAPSLTQTLGKDEIEETVQIFLGLTEQPAGETHVDYLYSSAEMVLPEVYKPQKYGLRGYARMKPGKRVKVEGQGILLAQSYLAEATSRPTALGGFLVVWQGVMRDITRADPDSFPAHQLSWQIPGLASNEELAIAERRLGVPLPAIYRETMQRSGPWRLSLPNGFSFELLAPSQLMPAGNWLQRHYDPAEWDLPENQTRRQQLRQDIVFGTVNGEPWVFRYSGMPCDDGSPSFAVGRADSKAFYLSAINACGANKQLETIRVQMFEALNRALIAPEFAVVSEDMRLYFERNKPPNEKKTLRLHLKADS